MAIYVGAFGILITTILRMFDLGFLGPTPPDMQMLCACVCYVLWRTLQYYSLQYAVNLSLSLFR